MRNYGVSGNWELCNYFLKRKSFSKLIQNNVQETLVNIKNKTHEMYNVSVCICTFSSICKCICVFTDLPLDNITQRSQTMSDHVNDQQFMEK